MSGTDGGGDRREFTSRTPANENPDRVVYRRGFVTRHQVSGWRFVMRRIASGVALHDTRMLVDPLRTQSRAVLVGALVLITGLAGCFVFSLIRPGGVAGNDAILADRDHVGALRPARRPVAPGAEPDLGAAHRRPARQPDHSEDQRDRPVRAGQPDRYPRCAGTHGAEHDRRCGLDSVRRRFGTGSGRDVDRRRRSTDGGERAAALPGNEAILVANESGPNAGTWLLWDGRRSTIDLDDRAVIGALGLGSEAPASRSIAPGLFNAIPEAPALSAPVHPRRG